MSKKLKGKGKRSIDKNEDLFDNTKKPKHPYDFKISDKIQDEQCKISLNKHWLSNVESDYEISNYAKLIKVPFNCIIVENLIKNEHLLSDLKDELLNQKFVTKNNDLYKFTQSSDLKGKQSSAIKGLKQFLANEVKPWLEEVTEISLSDTIDMFCAKYECGDYLLCHDDELEGKS